MDHTYLERAAGLKVERYLSGLPAFSIEGAKGVGKTTLAERYAKTVFRMDDEITTSLISGSPSILVDASKPVLIDEWHVVPSIWNTVRRLVDDDMTPGQYILTGSAAPLKAKLHSGAGRIVRMRMRPLSLAERKLAPALISLSDMMQGDVEVKTQQVHFLQHQYVKEILQSGFPGIRAITPDLQAEVLDGYIDNIIEKDFSETGIVIKSPESLRAWMRAYAAAEASTTSYESIMQAATPGQGTKPAKVTTMSYRDALTALWIMDPVEPWIPEGNIFTNLGKAPKHYLVDPALTARLLDIDERRLLSGKKVRILGSQTKTIIGRLFESLVAQSLKTYTDTLGLKLHHLRTSRGDHEVDFIIEQGDTIVALEAKFSTSVNEDDVKHLNWLERNIKDQKVIKAVLYTGEYLTRRESDGTLLIPAVCLSPS